MKMKRKSLPDTKEKPLKIAKIHSKDDFSVSEPRPKVLAKANKLVKNAPKSQEGEENKTKKRKVEEISAGGDVKEKLCEMKFKVRKLHRRKQEKITIYEVIHGSKKIWEDLRREDCPSDKREKLVNSLMNLVKGHVKQLIFAHDTVRVIECLMKYGKAEQRSMLFTELKDSILLLAQNKYSKFFLLKVLRCGTKEEKDSILNAFFGHVIKFARHTEASAVLEAAYNDYARARQRIDLVQEFYGPTFRVFKDPSITNLKDALDKLPAQRDAILQHINEILIKLTDKSVVRHSIIHHLLREYLSLAPEKGRSEVVEAYKEVLPEILHTKDGSRCAMMCVWYGTAKDRKSILKSLKSLCLKTAKEEHGCLMLMAIFDSVDDTKLVEKIVLSEILPNLKELVLDPNGRKVLLYLMQPRSSLHFHPDVVTILKQGDGNEHSKKDVDLRRNELRKMSSSALTQYLCNNMNTLLQSNSNSMFVLTVLKGLDDPTQVFESIANFVLETPYHPTQGIDVHPIEATGCQMLIKKLVLNDGNSDSVQFSTVLISLALPKVLKSWTECNVGAFHLLRLLRCNIPSVVAKVREELIGMDKKLSKKTYKGAEFLLEELKKMK